MTVFDSNKGHLNDRLRAVPEKERRLGVFCYAMTSKGPHLVAVVNRRYVLVADMMGHADADQVNTVFVLCSCKRYGHVLDVAKVTEAVRQLQGQPPKRRRVDVLSVSRVKTDT